jgi:hypothetical protein
MHAILCVLVLKHGSRYSDQAVGLDKQAIILRSSTATRDLSLLQNAQTDPLAYAVSYSIHISGSFPLGGGDKVAGA